MPRLSMVLELISLLAQPVLMALFYFFSGTQRKEES